MDTIMLAVLMDALADVTGIFYWLFRRQTKRLLAEGGNL
jgi:heme exporter protein C